MPTFISNNLQIEDISVIESGPHLEKKQAYVVIRHVKFGPSKKGGKKSKLDGDTSTVVSKGAATTSGDVSTSATCEESTAGIGSEDESSMDEAHLSIPAPTMQNFTKKVTNPAPETVHRPANFNSSNFSRPQPVHGFAREDTLQYSSPESSLGVENRYKRSEPRNQFPPTRSVDNSGPGMRDSVRSEAQFPNHRRQPPFDTNISPSMGERKQVGNDSSVFRNARPPSNIPKREPSGPNVPGYPSSSYGVFSNRKANVPGNSGAAGSGANQSNPGLKPDGSQSTGTDKKWGIFSR